MRAPLLAALILVSPGLAWAVDNAPLHVHVRVEGNYQHVWEGTVELDAVFTLVASSGRSYELPARTPLGALAAAAREAGMPLSVSDEFTDFVVLAVAGEAWWDLRWWDYRVNWVHTNYGAQVQWLAWGPGLQDGDSVLWYVETFGSTPLRLTGAGPAVQTGSTCSRAFLTESPAFDPAHNPGQPWPSLLWRPAQLARLRGASESPAPAGAALATAGESGWLWAEEHPLPYYLLYTYVRSNRAWLACP